MSLAVAVSWPASRDDLSAMSSNAAGSALRRLLKDTTGDQLPESNVPSDSITASSTSSYLAEQSCNSPPAIAVRLQMSSI
jgi:hypothetical protein